MPRAEAHRYVPSVWRDRMSELDLMILPQTIVRDLRYGVRTLLRNAVVHHRRDSCLGP